MTVSLILILAGDCHDDSFRTAGIYMYSWHAVLAVPLFPTSVSVIGMSACMLCLVGELFTLYLSAHATSWLFNMQYCGIKGSSDRCVVLLSGSVIP
jgi:hypothetical protein